MHFFLNRSIHHMFYVKMPSDSQSTKDNFVSGYLKYTFLNYPRFTKYHI